MKVEFKNLKEIPKSEIIALFNDPLIQRHMPLLKNGFNENDYDAFILAKENLWKKHGYGPWAFVVNGKFIGWGGLQYEQGDADLAVVIHPNFWGMGKTIYVEIIQKVTKEMNLESITALLPPSRTRTRGMLKLGFQKDGELDIDGQLFIRFRLYLPKR